jgi:hypothetical protein
MLAAAGGEERLEMVVTTVTALTRHRRTTTTRTCWAATARCSWRVYDERKSDSALGRSPSGPHHRAQSTCF